MNHRRDQYSNPPSHFLRGALSYDEICHAVPKRPKAYGCILGKSSIEIRLEWRSIACGSLSYQLALDVQNVPQLTPCQLMGLRLELHGRIGIFALAKVPYLGQWIAR